VSGTGDTVTVYPGLYAEDIDFLGRNISVISTDPADFDIIARTTIEGIVRFQGTEGLNCTLAGFNIDGRIEGSSDIVQHGHTHATISHCLLAGNITPCDPVIANCDGIIRHCVIAENSTRCRMVVPAIRDCHGRFENCTIARNVSGLMIRGACAIENSILYHGAGITLDADAALHISYCDLEGGREGIAGSGAVHWGPGNIDVDPHFARLGDWQAPGDYHLMSPAGRWDPIESRWVRDDVASPCIDAGDPRTAWAAEPQPHGKRINMGVYGGTPEASLSLSQSGDIADDDCDGFIAAEDLLALVEIWLSEGLLQVADLDGNGAVDFADFAALVQAWQGAAQPLEGPFEVALGKGAQWSPGRRGYDPHLPGYHLEGDIATIALRGRASRPVDELVLAISTLPSTTPMLENFTLTNPHVKLTGAPFKTGQLEYFERSDTDAKWQFVGIVSADRYFTFTVVDKVIHVTFQPAAIELLSPECEISWIDWYRR
jgi:hypothetical protein